MKQFSYRYRSLLGVEGTLDTESLKLTLRAIVLGTTVVLFSGGLTKDAAAALKSFLAKVTAP